MVKQRPKIEVKVQVIFEQEGRYITAYSPALEIAAQGLSLDEAKKNFEDAVNIFLKETVKEGTLEKVLRQLGWRVGAKQVTPPRDVAMPKTQVVSTQQSFKVPALV